MKRQKLSETEEIGLKYVENRMEDKADNLRGANNIFQKEIPPFIDQMQFDVEEIRKNLKIVLHPNHYRPLETSLFYSQFGAFIYILNPLQYFYLHFLFTIIYLHF